MNKYSSLEDLPSSLTVLDMASYLGISRTHAYNLLADTDIPRLRLGDRIIIPKNLFIDWIESNANKSKK